MTSERALVERVLAGEGDAFGVLVGRYQDSLYGFVRSRIRDADAASDVTQEAFVAAFENLGSLSSKEKFGAWLFGIARGKVLMHHRAAGRRPERTGAELDQMPALRDPALGAEEELEALLAGLDDEQRVVLLLRFRDGLSYREIAERLGMPPGTVATHLHRGRARAAQNHRRLHGATTS